MKKLALCDIFKITVMGLKDIVTFPMRVTMANHQYCSNTPRRPDQASALHSTVTWEIVKGTIGFLVGAWVFELSKLAIQKPSANIAIGAMTFIIMSYAAAYRDANEVGGTSLCPNARLILQKKKLGL